MTRTGLAHKISDSPCSAHFRVATKLSHMALSYVTPIDPIEGLTPAFLQRRPSATDVYWAVSTGRRNTGILCGKQVGVQCFCWGSPFEGLARPAIERGGDSLEVVGPVQAEVCAVGKVLAPQPIGVLVCATLPRAPGIAEVDRQTVLDPQIGVTRHLGPPIPGQRSAELFWQRHDSGDDGVADRLSAVPGKWWTILHAWAFAVTGHRREVQEHREPRRAFHQRPDRRSVQPQDEVALSMARHGPIGGFDWPFADHHLGRDEGRPSAMNARPWNAQRPRPVRRQAVSSRRRTPRPWI